MQEAAAGFRRQAAASRADGGMAWRQRSGGPIWAQMGPVDLALICLVSLVSVLTSSLDVSGLFSQHKALGASVRNPGAAAPGMVVASISSAGGGQLARCRSLDLISSIGIELGRYDCR
jgi:hypothetical protein